MVQRWAGWCNASVPFYGDLDRTISASTGGQFELQQAQNSNTGGIFLLNQRASQVNRSIFGEFISADTNAQKLLILWAVVVLWQPGVFQFRALNSLIHSFFCMLCNQPYKLRSFFQMELEEKFYFSVFLYKTQHI